MVYQDEELALWARGHSLVSWEPAPTPPEGLVVSGVLWRKVDVEHVAADNNVKCRWHTDVSSSSGLFRMSEPLGIRRHQDDE